MRNLLLAISLIIAADLDANAQAADELPGTIQVDSQPVPASSSTSNISANAPAKNHSPDCNGQSASTTSVSALLSRLVRASTIVQGVQCPISPVPDQATAQELHP